MAIKPKSERAQEKEVIDLQGPQGNAYYLLARAQSFAGRIGYTNEEIEELLEDMKSDDYEHLILIFDEHFGEFIDLQR